MNQWQLVNDQAQERSIAVEEIKTKKVKVINSKTLLVTVDIGKTLNMGYYRCSGGTESKPFEFSNTGRGFRKLWDHICKAVKTYSLEDVVAGFESTGVYGEPLMHFLRKKQGVKIVQVNPMHTKRLKELQGNSPNKTDKKDPKVIADIIELGHSLTVVVPEGAAAELRGLTNARERSVRRRTVLLNQLQGLIYVVFPEFLQIMKGVKTKSARYLLQHIALPEDILAYGLEPLIQTLRKVSYGRLGKERACALYNAAEESVGILEGRSSILLEIAESLSAIAYADQFIEKLERGMTEHLKKIPYSRFILSMQGIGEVTTAGLIGEVGDFNQYRTIAEITKLAGLDLFEISSGKHKGNRRISKRGRLLMRKLLYYAAMNMVSRDGVMRRTYQRHIQRGMVKMKALIAIARKLLGIIFALVRNHSEYIPDYDATGNALKAA
jgi:transposase